MKHLHLEQPIQSQPQSKLTMEKDESSAPAQELHNAVNANNESPKNRKLVDTSSARLDDTHHDNQPQRDVCNPKFGSWCDDSSTEQDDDDDDDDDESIGGGSFDSNDNIVINMASLTTECNTYTAFYFSYRVNEQNTRDSQDQEDEDDDDQDNDFGIRISQKRRSDEDLFLRNLRRRQLRFAEQPSVREFEPAPVACRDDMYYSCHQLQKMMDAYHAGRECHLDD